MIPSDTSFLLHYTECCSVEGMYNEGHYRAGLSGIQLKLEALFMIGAFEFLKLCPLLRVVHFGPLFDLVFPVLVRNGIVEAADSTT